MTVWFKNHDYLVVGSDVTIYPADLIYLRVSNSPVNSISAALTVYRREAHMASDKGLECFHNNFDFWILGC